MAGKLLTLLDVGQTPVSLALKPDGGELFVCNFDSDSVSVIETSTNEVGSTFLIGTHPSHAVVSNDNSLLYVSNFGADAVAVYSIDTGKFVASIMVGSRPDALALSPNQHFLLVADALAGDVAVILKRDKTTRANPAPFALHTLVPVGIQPNQIAVKVFITQTPAP